MSGGPRILVVEDERSMREFLEILLGRHNYEVTVAEDGDAGRQALADHEYDLVITDLKMPGISGIDVLKHTKEHFPATEVIMVTAFATTETAIEAMKIGAYDYLLKPFKVDEILVTVQRALEKRNLVRDNETLRRRLTGSFHLENLVGRSPQMQRVFELIRRIANTKTNVLISGESGTGKELVAHAIHSLSERSEHQFVPVNCGAIPDALMESELFGHVRGAFTGAAADKQGLFAVADGGTLFLDEIGELDPSMQVKLLRALQERTIKPVGSAKERSVDVRILAASNRDLDHEIKAGRFRSDLFYRLNVIPVALPPLRERPQDVPLLTDVFVRKFAAEFGREAPRITPEALALLCRYHYPGNVRELENLIERAVALAANDEIDGSSLPELTAAAPTGRDPQDQTQLPDSGMDLDAHLSAIEHNLLDQALQRTAGNRTEAARLLGLSLRSLRYRLAKSNRGGSEIDA